MNRMDISHLRYALSYDSATGEFLWVNPTSPRHKPGDPAGYLSSYDGYWKITLDHQGFQAHRLAGAYVHGEWPELLLDHINGDRADNRIANLRQATNSENMQNRRGSPSHSSGDLLGVSWHALRGKWRARIRVDGHQRHLGLFETQEAAHAAYLAAKVKLHPFMVVAA